MRVQEVARERDRIIQLEEITRAAEIQAAERRQKFTAWVPAAARARARCEGLLWHCARAVTCFTSSGRR